MMNLKIREEAKDLLKILEDSEHKDVVAAFICYEEIYDDLMDKYDTFENFYDEYIRNDKVLGLKDIYLLLY